MLILGLCHPRFSTSLAFPHKNATHIWHLSMCSRQRISFFSSSEVTPKALFLFFISLSTQYCWCSETEIRNCPQFRAEGLPDKAVLISDTPWPIWFHEKKIIQKMRLFWSIMKECKCIGNLSNDETSLKGKKYWVTRYLSVKVLEVQSSVRTWSRDRAAVPFHLALRSLS